MAECLAVGAAHTAFIWPTTRRALNREDSIGLDAVNGQSKNDNTNIYNTALNYRGGGGGVDELGTTHVLGF